MEENKTQMLYGIHPVMEAIRAGRTFDKVLLKQGMEGEQFRQLYALIGEKKINCQFVPVERLNRAVRGAHQCPRLNLWDWRKWLKRLLARPQILCWSFLTV